MLLLGILCVSLATACLPIILRQLNSKSGRLRVSNGNDWLPAVAGLLFLVAWFIPTVPISKETTTFQQHFVGGGMYSALLYIYTKQVLRIRPSQPINTIYLFAWVSSFGVANELLEFTITKLGLARIATGDTSWDLLANTTGAFFGYFAYIGVRKILKAKGNSSTNH